MNKPLIITVPNKILGEVATPVTSFDDVLKNQIQMMRNFLKTQEGVGLAANQLGFGNRVVIIEFVNPQDKKDNIPFQVFINPKIVELSREKDEQEEGCLSLPKIELPVERSTKIKIRYQNISGKKAKLTARDIIARILQHETDHLNGTVFTDRVREKLFLNFPDLKKKKIVFVGTGDFAVSILESLILLSLNLFIITEKAKPAGRRKELKPSPVAETAKKFGKGYFETDDITDLSLPFSSPPLLICVDFGQKIPEKILKLSKLAINIHPSLLPKYRGPSPISSAILAGEQESGVTIIKMTKEFDQGPILARTSINIFPTDNSLTLENRLAVVSLKLLFKILPKICQNQIKTVPQDESQATQTLKIKKEDVEINWNEDSELIERKIRAFYPQPKAYAFIGDKRLIIHRAHLEKNKLIIDIVQEEGKKPISWSEFLRGWRGPKPKWFDR